MGLRDRLRRLEREAEKVNAPALDEYWSATRRETARRLRSAYDRLARLPGNGPPTPYPGRDHRDTLLADETPERAEADRQVVQKWETANGTPDITSHAERVRARLRNVRSPDTSV